MDFTVACNWDTRLLDSVDNKHIKSFFGQCTGDLIGGGRGSFLAPKKNQEQAIKYIKKAKALGFEFNYLINGACLNNQEFIREYHNQIINYLEWVYSLDVDMVTVSMPFLIEIIRRRFPDLKICVSSWARIESPNRAKHFERLGANKIILQEHVNRNFKTLKNIRKAVFCEIELIANNSCLYTCPYEFNHINMMTHSSQGGHETKGFVIDHCQLRCQVEKLKNPIELIKSRWIRPEDVGEYESIGINTLKLVERFRTTESMLEVIDAYANRRYDRNMINLLTLPRKGAFIKPNIEYLLNPDYVNIDYILKIADAYGYNFNELLYLDGKKLDGFLDIYKKTDCLNQDCETCGYCKKLTEKAITITNPESRRYFLKNLTGLLNRLYEGDVSSENPKIELLGYKMDAECDEALEIVLKSWPLNVNDFIKKRIIAVAESYAKERCEEIITKSDIVTSYYFGTLPSARKDALVFLRHVGMDNLLWENADINKSEK